VSLHQREPRTPYNNIDEAKSRSKRAAGELSGDDDLKRDGTVDTAAGKAKGDGPQSCGRG
jgi:uncharacterized protein YjbJ (UPF0337 family)